MPTYVLHGRVTPERRLEVTLPADVMAGEAEVTVRVDDAKPTGAAALIALLDEWEKLPPVGRTAEEIDRDIEDQRNSWD